LAGGGQVDPVAEAKFVDDGTDRAKGESRCVAVGAEMAKKKVREILVDHSSDEAGGSLIGEVAMAREDALFHGPRAPRIALEEGQIVVGLQEKRLAVPDALDDEFGRMAEVRQEPEAGGAVFDDEADRVTGVVWDGECLDHEVADGKAVARDKQSPLVEFREGMAEAVGGGAIAVEGELVRAAQDAQSRGVVGVLVGQENAVEVLKTKPHGLQPPRDLAGAETGIDQESGLARFDEGAVSRTPAAQDSEPQHGPICRGDGGRGQGGILAWLLLADWSVATWYRVPLRFTQSQSLQQAQVFTAQMQQALAMLQAPAMELRSLVQKELSENPVLEEPPETAPEPAGDGDDAFLDAKIAQLREMDEDTRAYFFRERSGPRATAEDEEKRQFFFDSVVEARSLADHLEEQLRFATTDLGVLRAGLEIIGDIDEDGFLRATDEEIAAGCAQPPETVARALALVRSFDPVGVGARDLRECLLIQLERLGKGEALESSIVRDHLEDLGRRRFDQIARACGEGVRRVVAAAEFIATLVPKPGRAFLPENRSDIVVPEVFVTRGEDGEWRVAVNEDCLPRLRISNEYKEMLASSGGRDDLRRYLRDRIRSGKSFIHAIRQRQDTIRRIAEEIVRRQTDFLNEGVSRLKPMTLAQVAEAVGVHETTVSRAIANKYAQTPWGVFELKFFFAPGYRISGGESLSNKSVKEALQQIIDGEDRAHPFSDEQIVKIFEGRGLPIARRTIAKYRTDLGILPASMRRRD